jgi:GTP diphosphokinase / guanosine-3',5'-bis(diphosphate) 3'-diphosphatase
MADIDKTELLPVRGSLTIRLADKTCNLRDIASNPPSGWPLERRQQYFEWAKEVIDGMRGDWRALERLFDDQYKRKPSDAE